VDKDAGIVVCFGSINMINNMSDITKNIHQIPTMLGFCGYARVGKNTAADEIARIRPELNLTNIGFADTLKADIRPCILALEELGIDTTTPAFKELFRPMWVLWSRVAKDCAGTELIWVDRIKPVLDLIRKQNKIPAIIDVRYHYEVDFIIANGGRVIYIERPGFGPANAEEEKSFAQIFENYPHLKDLSVTNNSTKLALAENILTRLNMLP